jgi:hypothetical protein
MATEVVKKITVTVPAGTDISGFQDLSLLDFVSGDVQVYASGNGLQIKGLADTDPDVDVYPGGDPGELRFTRDLFAGEFVTVITHEAMSIEVKSSQSYDTATETLEILVWVEENGMRQLNPDQATALVTTSTGTLVANLGSDGTPDARGIFRFVQVGLPLTKRTIHVVEVTALLNGKTLSGNRTFTLY